MSITLKLSKHGDGCLSHRELMHRKSPSNSRRRTRRAEETSASGAANAANSSAPKGRRSMAELSIAPAIAVTRSGIKLRE
jgi:hypothetical protein